MLKGMGTPPSFYIIFLRKTTFVTSCLLPLSKKLFQKGSTFKEKNLLLGRNSLILDFIPFEKARKT